MKRTNNREVARRFAEGLPAVNSNGQYYTDGRVLYSYGPHWPVAAWINGRLHLNDDKHSVTTSKHRSFAVSGLVTQGRTRQLDEAVHHANVYDMRAAVERAK